ncbi:hypothetical protein NC653_010671 [Populus alba x Populus x berolinensis]|uniref:Uncharacterized protein n=1 Tax=Populus alba x Populus x berolinensis TaxID=444605 RepID=A0AAD6R0G0_9ROSI|nr:hypothetical protein NC653_010671 [Populus alba x Populus x berolinensis]
MAGRGETREDLPAAARRSRRRWRTALDERRCHLLFFLSSSFSFSFSSPVRPCISLPECPVSGVVAAEDGALKLLLLEDTKTVVTLVVTLVYCFPWSFFCVSSALPFSVASSAFLRFLCWDQFREAKGQQEQWWRVFPRAAAGRKCKVDDLAQLLLPFSSLLVIGRRYWLMVNLWPSVDGAASSMGVATAEEGIVDLPPVEEGRSGRLWKKEMSSGKKLGEKVGCCERWFLARFQLAVFGDG